MSPIFQEVSESLMEECITKGRLEGSKAELPIHLILRIKTLQFCNYCLKKQKHKKLLPKVNYAPILLHEEYLRWGLCSSVNVPKAAELFTTKQFIVCYLNCTSSF